MHARNYVTICMGLYWCVQLRARKSINVPDPFLSLRVGSGNKTSPLCRYFHSPFGIWGEPTTILTPHYYSVSSPLVLYFVMFPIESWSERRELCVSMFQSIISKFLLGNSHLCLPCCSSNYRFSSGIPNKEGEATRTERF